jgi:2-polyprenyl-3-methyl-5-hydroxy-6-metoxy-1,4-benzoquinol methylase
MPACAANSSTPHPDIQGSSTEVRNANVEVLDRCPLCDADSLGVLDFTANLCECKRCGYVFDSPRPTLSALIAFYSQPTKYDQRLAEEPARDALWTRRLGLLRPIAKPGALLDVGAGIGQFLAIARPYFSEVYGTEVSEIAIDIARQKYNLQLLAGEIQSVEFGNKKFDNITIFHVLEHVQNPKQVIETCASHLVDGGTLTIAVPNDLYSYRGKRFLRTFAARKFGRFARVGLPKIVLDGSLAEIHFSHFTPQVLRRLLEHSGFSIIACTLDPHYVAVGFAQRRSTAFYLCFRLLNRIFGTNVYDIMLLVARKVSFPKTVDKRNNLEHLHVGTSKTLARLKPFR